MKNKIISASPIFLAAILLQVGSSLTGSLISIGTEIQENTPWISGTILSAFYVGAIAGALLTPSLIERWGNKAFFWAAALMLAVCTVCFPLDDTPLTWIVLRLATGMAMTGLFVSMESLLNHAAGPQERARLFSFYIMSNLAGMALGQASLNARFLGDQTLFIGGAAMMLATAAAIMMVPSTQTVVQASRSISIFQLARRAPIGVICVVLSGYTWAGLVASGPALATRLAYDDFTTSLFLTSMVVAGMAAQYPVGWCADHFNRRKVLASLCGAAAVISIIAAVSPEPAFIQSFAVIFGAATFPLYAIGASLTQAELDQVERTAATAASFIYFEFGAIAAPYAIGHAMEVEGASGYFVAQAIPPLMVGTIAMAALLRART